MSQINPIKMPPQIQSAYVMNEHTKLGQDYGFCTSASSSWDVILALMEVLVYFLNEVLSSLIGENILDTFSAMDTCLKGHWHAEYMEWCIGGWVGVFFNK